MSLFHEHFGRLGKLSEHDWEKMLDSDNGLFKRNNHPPRFVIGPQLTDSGKITGDAFTMEVMAFMQHSTKDQQEFAKELSKANPVAYRQYVLVISGSFVLWKRDIRWLRIAYRYLRKEEHLLEEEEHLIEKQKRELASFHIPRALKRHFPALFSDVELEGNDLDAMFEKIRGLEHKVHDEEDYLGDYLKHLERDYPFLF
jgi:hypothetical protein